MSNDVLFVDLSSNNAPPNIAAYAKAGHKVIALKASEATGYIWDQHARIADQAHARGLAVLHYHFARPGSGVAQAATFLKAVNGHTAPGDGLVIDCEVAGVNGKNVTAFLNRVHTAHPHLDLWIYGGGYFLRDAGIKPVHNAKLWLADYTTAPHPQLIPPGWSNYDAWQYTDAGTVAGVRGHVDVSRLEAAITKPHPKPPKARKSWWVRAWRRWTKRHGW